MNDFDLNSGLQFGFAMSASTPLPPLNYANNSGLILKAEF